MSEPEKRSKENEVDIKPANLWSKIQAQVLGTNPYLGNNDDGQTIVRCPRCEFWDLDMNYTALSVVSGAVQWSGVVRKCQRCAHLFCLIQ